MGRLLERGINIHLPDDRGSHRSPESVFDSRILGEFRWDQHVVLDGDSQQVEPVRIE
jgi:hypothetical protein